MMRAGFYDMAVSHRRLHPQAHALRSRITALLLDLDELPSLDRRLKLFSVGGRNLASFHSGDHGDGSGDLRGWLARQFTAAGIVPPAGQTLLLCMPRLLGRSFNPLSIFFCHDASGNLAALLYEVRNTFGERHSYAVPVTQDSDRLRHGAEKRFYVSPFMPMDMTYRFDLRRDPASHRLSVVISGADAHRPLIRAAMTGVRRDITDRALLAAGLRAPLQGLQVLARIHLEAVKLWWKGARFYARPAPPATTVTPGA